VPDSGPRPGDRYLATKARTDLVALDHLQPLERRDVWRGIKQLDPAFAAVLRDDPFVAALRERFGAVTCVPLGDYSRYLDARREEEACTTASRT
jgi:hypothetical protein